MVTPERIGLARRRRGLTATELARRLQVSAQSVTNYEHGRQNPSTRTVKALASTLDFPESFFYQPACDEIPDEGAAFRARSKTSLRKRAAALSTGTLAVDINTRWESVFQLPPPDVATLEGPDPATAADITRARWDLGNTAAPNMIHLLESRGVRVFALPREHVDVDAFSFWHAGTPYIVLNTAKTPERSRFDAAHELGHLVMHGATREAQGPIAEREANTFAGAFLMPEVSIQGHMPHGPLPDQVVAAKRTWGVSALALTYRLHELGLLNDWQYRTMCVELSRRGYRTSEQHGINPETSQLLNKILTELRRTGRSMRQVAAELHLSTDELASMMLGLVITPINGTGETEAAPRDDSQTGSPKQALTLV